MNSTLSSRASLFALVAVTHVALLWLMMSAAVTSPLSMPVPHPAVMVEMLAPSPPPARIAPPLPASEPLPVIRRDPPKPAPVPKVKRERAQPPAEKKEAPRIQPAAEPDPAPPAAPPAAPAPPAPAIAQPTAAPASTASATPPAPAPLAIAPPRFNAAYLSNPVPAYPLLLRRAGEEGRVVLRVLVTPEGNAGEVLVWKPANWPAFDDAAVAAVRKWRFIPARQGEAAVAAWVQVPIEFKLN